MVSMGLLVNQIEWKRRGGGEEEEEEEEEWKKGSWAKREGPEQLLKLLGSKRMIDE